MKSKNLFLKLMIAFLSITNVSCDSSFVSSSDSTKIYLDPLTMTLEDYKGIDFRDVVDGEVKLREPNDVSNIKIEDDREPLENEIKIPIYIYENDKFDVARYQYFIKGEDYRGYPYSSNHVDTESSWEKEGRDWGGIGSKPYIIGFYEDSKFEKLIDPNKFISVDESIKEIHVRRAQEHYVPNQMYTGTYKSENLNVVADGRNFDIYFDNIHYKIIGKGTGGEFHIKEMYIDNELVEDLENYEFLPEIISYSINHAIYFCFWKNGTTVIPFSEMAISEIAYSAIANL